MSARTRRREEALGSLKRFRDIRQQAAGLYEERTRAIREAYAAEATIQEIADTLGIARKMVYDAIKGEGSRNGGTR